jgi:hypothetical protein
MISSNVMIIVNGLLKQGYWIRPSCFYYTSMIQLIAWMVYEEYHKYCAH